MGWRGLPCSRACKLREKVMGHGLGSMTSICTLVSKNMFSRMFLK